MPDDDVFIDNSGNLNKSGPSDLNLVFGNPLFLHPNDTSGNPIISFKLTGTENYNMWNYAMILLDILLDINPSMALINEQMLKLMSLLNEKPIPTANANMAGANQHMTVSANFLINVVDVSNLRLTVGHPNGTQALIIKIGDLKINDHITLYNVLVVPEYKVSLLSVHKLARDNNLFVGFDDHKYYIQDFKENKIVGIGNVNDGLYLFNIDFACHGRVLLCACFEIICALSLRFVQFALFAIEGDWQGFAMSNFGHALI
ncbi:hypothetical protein Tco_1274119 [Tanacetum coccineum]